MSGDEIRGSYGLAAVIFMVGCSILGLIALIKVGKDPVNYFVAGALPDPMKSAVAFGSTPASAPASALASALALALASVPLPLPWHRSSRAAFDRGVQAVDSLGGSSLPPSAPPPSTPSLPL